MRVLAGAAVVLTLAFAAMAGLGELPAHVRAFTALFILASGGYALAVAGVLRRPPRSRASLVLILAAGLVFRLLLWPLPASLSTDAYRYLWDGWLTVSGVSPYRAPPSAPALAALRDAVVFPKLNHADWLTIYPPGAELLFAAVAWAVPRSLVAWKAVLLGFESVTAAALLGWLRARRRPEAWVLLYAWHPLVVVEFAGSGHLDAVALATSTAALWAAARGREGWAGALVGLGTLVKLYPALLLAAVGARRRGRACLAAAVVVGGGYAVYGSEGWAVLGSLGRYLAEEEFNGTLRALLEPLLAPLGVAGPVTARLLPLAALGALAAVVLCRPEWAVERRALVLVGAYLLATPNLFPWYALWVVPIVAVAPTWPWLHLSCAVALTYLVFAEPVWRIPGWVRVVEFGPLAVGLGLAAWRAARPSRGARAPASRGPLEVVP
jgi:alpha-1,6-mannosyltransferase